MTAVDFLKRPYARVVIPDGENCWRAEILEFPGCIALGETQADALSYLEDVAESWITSMLERGQPVPTPIEENEYSGKLVLRLAKSLHQKAANAARLDGVSLNTFITTSVAEQLGQRSSSFKVSNVFWQHTTNFLSLNNATAPIVFGTAGSYTGMTSGTTDRTSNGITASQIGGYDHNSLWGKSHA